MHQLKKRMNMSFLKASGKIRLLKFILVIPFSLCITAVLGAINYPTSCTLPMAKCVKSLDRLPDFFKLESLTENYSTDVSVKDSLTNMPVPQGGLSAYRIWIGYRFDYSVADQVKDTLIVIRFMVGKDGRLSHSKQVKE